MLALKGLGLVAALGAGAAEHAHRAAEAEQLSYTQGIEGLLEFLVVTMAAHPLPHIRNAAHYAMGALIDGLAVRSLIVGTAWTRFLQQNPPQEQITALSRGCFSGATHRHALYTHLGCWGPCCICIMSANSLGRRSLTG